MGLVESEKRQKNLLIRCYLFLKNKKIDLNLYWKCGLSKTKNCNANLVFSHNMWNCYGTTIGSLLRINTSIERMALLL